MTVAQKPGSADVIPSSRRRQNLAVAFVALPALLGALWLVWSELALQPSRADPSISFATAIEGDDILEVFAHIRAGADPNAPIPYRDEELTGGEELMLTPLVIAVGNGRADTVRTLLSSGARTDAAGNRLALCLARRAGHDAAAQILLEQGGASEICPEQLHPDHAPLRTYID
jgi:hypothetical protein